MNYHVMKATKNEDDKDMVISGFTAVAGRKGS